MAFVRAKGPDGAEFTADERAVLSMGETVQILDKKAAVDGNGRPLAPKPLTDNAGQPVTNTPSPSWLLADLEQYATDKGVEFAEGSTKAVILAAIAASNQTPEA